MVGWVWTSGHCIAVVPCLLGWQVPEGSAGIQLVWHCGLFTCGVLQGSLSPMLFHVNIYMKWLGKAHLVFGVGCNLFAVDYPTQSHLSIQIKVILKWWSWDMMGNRMWVNKLKSRPDKTEISLVQKFTLKVLDYQPVLNRVAFPLQDKCILWKPSWIHSYS